MLAVLSGCEPSPVSNAATPAGGPGAVPSQVLNQFELQDMRDGVKSMTLIATVARIYEVEQYADVESPKIYFYQKEAPEKPSSQLDAPTGRVNMSTHEVEAWGGVTVVTADSSTLRTDRLRYDPRIRKILSDSAVEFSRPGSVTRGVGLESDPELKRARIRNQKAEITPSQ